MYDCIFIANDHAGTEYKKELIKVLSKYFKVVDLGTNTSNSVNYVDYADRVCLSVNSHKNSLGILICGTGIGISIAANKHKGIRCALLYSDSVASLAKQHNNANVIAFGAREMTLNDIINRIEIFLNTKFEGGRHQERIDSMN